MRGASRYLLEKSSGPFTDICSNCSTMRSRCTSRAKASPIPSYFYDAISEEPAHQAQTVVAIQVSACPPRVYATNTNHIVPSRKFTNKKVPKVYFPFPGAFRCDGCWVNVCVLPIYRHFAVGSNAQGEPSRGLNHSRSMTSSTHKEKLYPAPCY